VLEFVLVVAY